MSDHQLLEISTWAEVAILAFMVWDKYGPNMGVSPMLAQLTHADRWPGFLKFFSQNMTIIFAAIGLGIVIYLHFNERREVIYRPSAQQIDAAVAPIQAQLTQVRQQLAAKEAQLEVIEHPKPSPPPQLPPPPPRPHYTAGEIEIMEGALRNMYSVLTGQCKPAADADWHLANILDSQPDVINSDPRDFARKLSTDRDSIKKCSVALRKIVDDNNLYANELNQAMPTDNGASLGGFLDILIRELNELGKTPVKLDVQMLLHDTLNQWAPTSRNYGKWVADTTDSVTQRIEELRNWK